MSFKKFSSALDAPAKSRPGGKSPPAANDQAKPGANQKPAEDTPTAKP